MTILAIKETEAFFKVLDESSELLKEALSTSYLDAFIESGDNLIDGHVQVEDGRPDDKVVQQLRGLYDSVDRHQLNPGNGPSGHSVGNAESNA